MEEGRGSQLPVGVTGLLVPPLGRRAERRSPGGDRGWGLWVGSRSLLPVWCKVLQNTEEAFREEELLMEEEQEEEKEELLSLDDNGG